MHGATLKIVIILIEETFTFVNSANGVGCDAVHILYRGTHT